MRFVSIAVIGNQLVRLSLVVNAVDTLLTNTLIAIGGKR